ncbi:hypothetical protein ACJX0J_040539, partial [Zea mays]
MAQLMASTLAEKGRPALAPAPVPTSAVEQVPACRGTQRARQRQVEAADPAVEAPRATKGRKPPSLAAEGHAAAGRPSALLPVLEELRATTEQTRVHLVEARAHLLMAEAERRHGSDTVWNGEEPKWRLDQSGLGRSQANRVQDDWVRYAKMTEEIGEQLHIVGDDLVTNPTSRVAPDRPRPRNPRVLTFNQGSGARVAICILFLKIYGLL